MREFLFLAKWAFGPDGVQSLQILAYGDFSYRGRFADSLLLLLRDRSAPHGFRPAVQDDMPGMQSLYTDNMDFFAACPAHTIVDDVGLL